jgi:predicted RNA binding protein YcfA (HicA-like mRNA interferase family)
VDVTSDQRQSSYLGKIGSTGRLSIPLHGNQSLKVGLLRHLAKIAEISLDEI